MRWRLLVVTISALAVSVPVLLAPPASADEDPAITGRFTAIMAEDMRSVELPFTLGDGDSLRVTAPPNGRVAPPGYYYLFLMKDNGRGLTPSNARIIHVGAAADLSGDAVAPMGVA